MPVPLPVQRICQPDMLPAEDGSCVGVGYWGTATVQVAPILPETGSDGRLVLAAMLLGGLGVALILIARH